MVGVNLGWDIVCVCLEFFCFSVLMMLLLLGLCERDTWLLAGHKLGRTRGTGANVITQLVNLY